MSIRWISSAHARPKAHERNTEKSPRYLLVVAETPCPHRRPRLHARPRSPPPRRLLPSTVLLGRSFLPCAGLQAIATAATAASAAPRPLPPPSGLRHRSPLQIPSFPALSAFSHFSAISHFSAMSLLPAFFFPSLRDAPSSPGHPRPPSEPRPIPPRSRRRLQGFPTAPAAAALGARRGFYHGGARRSPLGPRS